MTFNIRGALYEDGANHWRHRAALNLRTIQSHAPDLIGLQEAHLENLAYYCQQGTHLIVERAAQVSKTCDVSKVVLTGDFNCMPASAALSILKVR